MELSTRTKIFCGCTTAFGGEPNTHCCPICIGLPGTLPKLNRQVVNYAVLAGLATHCEIAESARMDRKNYVYPDLAKAYQISQFDKPLCEHGWVELESGKKIRLTRIHIEEDAGKLVHERGDTFVDYNRAGVPLIEIVTEPDFRSIDEVREYVEKLQILMKYIGVSDAKMQEGSLRCDVNISVRPVGSDTLGTRTEIKNMNSFTYIARAMEYEMERQIDLLESGQPVVQETLRYNVDTGETESMRGKEDAQDYRYFREPDLVAIEVPREEIEALRAQLPELPDQKYARYTGELGLPAGDARLLTKYRRAAEFFDAAAKGFANPEKRRQPDFRPHFPVSGDGFRQGGLPVALRRGGVPEAPGASGARQAADEPPEIHPGKDAGDRQAGGCPSFRRGPVRRGRIRPAGRLRGRHRRQSRSRRRLPERQGEGRQSPGGSGDEGHPGPGGRSPGRGNLSRAAESVNKSRPCLPHGGQGRFCYFPAFSRCC